MSQCHILLLIFDITFFCDYDQRVQPAKKEYISKNTHLFNKVYFKMIIQVHTELNVPYIQYPHGRLKNS